MQYALNLLQIGFYWEFIFAMHDGARLASYMGDAGVAVLTRACGIAYIKMMSYCSC